MPGLTLDGQSTKLTYLFNTYNHDLAPENMSHFLLGVDILWATYKHVQDSCPHIDLTKIVIAAAKGSNFMWNQYFESLEQAKKSKFYHLLPLESYKEEGGKHASGHPEILPKLLSRMLQEGTMCFEDWQNYARFWLSNFNNQKQVSAVGTEGAGEAITSPEATCPTRNSDFPMALQEVFQREKEIILILSAEENDLNSLKELELMGTNLEAKRGIYVYVLHTILKY